MGPKLLWAGLTGIVALPLLWNGLPWALLGALLMVVGLVLTLLDK